MTKERLHQLLYGDTELPADQRLSEIGDALVVTAVTSGEAFWQAPRVEQLLYALCCVLHHAGANGLRAMWDYNEGNSAAIMAAAVEALELVGDTELHQAAAEFWHRVVSKSEAPVPIRFSSATRSDYEAAEQTLWSAYPRIFAGHEIETLGDRFLSCGNTAFPGRVLVWLRSHEEALAHDLCTDETVA